MNFNYLMGLFMLALFFIDCVLAGRIGPFAFVSLVVSAAIALAWHWYFQSAKPAVPLQRIKFGNQYLLVEVA